MAGSGNELTTWASSAAYHQDKGDYNDNVIVPRSILVDTADAIRIKKSGTAEVKSDVDVSGETFLTSSSMTPEDFATEISNIASLEFPTHKSGSTSPMPIYRNVSANTNTRTIVGYTVKNINTSQYTATAADFQVWWDSVVFFGLTYCVYRSPNTDTYIALFSKDHFYYCKKHNLPWFEAGWTIYNPNNYFKPGVNEIASGNIYQNVNGSPLLPFIAMSDLLNPHDAEYPWQSTISTSATPPTTHFHMYEKTTGTVGATTATTSQTNPQNWYETVQYAGIGGANFRW